MNKEAAAYDQRCR